MASNPSSRRRRRVVEDESDPDSDGLGGVGESKRRRLEQQIDEAVLTADSPTSTRTKGVNGVKTHPDDEGFQPGAIRRVKVKNFVTYEMAEFFPGPNLNMVIGPNGTGKSSLVCAICLGLGFSPKHLGRAGNVKEFVKHGKASAIIEIELQRRPRDRDHHVIRVQIDRERNSLKWWLNGADTTHKTIQTLMRDLKIQVDNLCQFLPQDRVVEFASATPVDLLHETLRAAAPLEMLDWQSSLQALHKEYKEHLRGSENSAEQLKSLEERQADMQNDVDRLREQEEARQRVKDLGDARHVADYLEARSLYRDKRAEEKLAVKTLKKLENEAAPSLQAVNRKQEYHEQLSAAVHVRKEAIRRAEAAGDTLLTAIEEADEQVKATEARITTTRKGYDTKRQELGKIRSKIGVLENQAKNKPPEFSPQEHNTQIREKEHSLREIETDFRQLDAKIRDIKDQGQTKSQMRNRLNVELENLNSQEGQLLNFIQKKWPDVAKGGISKGSFWTDQPVDESEKAEIRRQLNEVEAEFQALKEQNTVAKEQMAQLHERRKEIHEDLKMLKERKNELQKAYNAWQGIPIKLEAEKKALEQKRIEVEEAKGAIQELGFDADRAYLNKAKATLQHHAALAAIREAQESLLEAQIREIEAKSDVQGLKVRNNDLMQQLEVERQHIVALGEESQQLRQRAEAAQGKVATLFHDNPNPERRELLEQLAKGKTLEDIDNEVAAEEGKIELIHVSNPGALREFEKRAREIEKLRQRMETSTNKLEDLDNQIQDIHARWEPKLDELISKINDAFSYNFEQINCAGEVRVHKDDDFDNWALDIMVKFRENETLQQLNQHRQSGGERAVSTIFYLMALQSMAQSPFRVVDEINQGMDPRNERMVHERMVEIACREHTSQYFLITPKLLTGLRYDPHMRILCIASGTHMPQDGSKLDFNRCLQVHKRVAAGV
ncbi:Structural maintenance of chromosomes protein 5 [Colletotrichum trifolii]|uniref:Structural maintenance of chromosomes protein 5 n=1 Tax=Colletotrichum trifolii TaxID=5466 RepID=A0A4V3HVJ9_COLTR|nr:Structural maintenance of chromosomes protein 5 [Colletotrichum trifolii]